MERISTDEAFEILKAKDTPEDVIAHCKAVSSLAREFAERISGRGVDVDVDFVASSALLHDVGRSATHSIRHGVEGAKILSSHPMYARVCRCHIGGGITADEAVGLGLEGEDFVPESLEEKIVCVSDKLVFGVKRVSLDAALAKFSKRLGPEHPSIFRIRMLYDEVVGLAGWEPAAEDD